MRAPASVSYTHLDVYKRQVIDCVRSIISYPTLVPIELRPAEVGNERSTHVKLCRLIRKAVSYTHLDVYKRQRQYCSKLL